MGLTRNPWLQTQVEFAELTMKDEYERTGAKQRMVDEFPTPHRLGRTSGA